MFIKNFELFMKKLICLIAIFSSISFSQKYSLLISVGNFDNSSSFSIASDGSIYVTDKGKDEVIKLDTLGNVLKNVGGFGWNSTQFDEPIDVFADPLSVYVTDKNNHRIQRFDRNLNFISQLFTRENDNPDERFGYPNGCTVSNQGDLYILDSENNRVVVFDLFGNFKLQFGGIDAGRFALRDPKAIAISPGGIIFIADGNSIVSFDQFGNGISKVEFEQQINSLEIIFDKIIVTSDNKILSGNVTRSNIEFSELITEPPISEGVVSSLLFNNRLYILTQKEIQIFAPFSE